MTHAMMLKDGEFPIAYGLEHRELLRHFTIAGEAAVGQMAELFHDILPNDHHEPAIKIQVLHKDLLAYYADIEHYLTWK